MLQPILKLRQIRPAIIASFFFLVLSGCEQDALLVSSENEPMTEQQAIDGSWRKGRAVPGQYIITLKDTQGNVKELARQMIRANRGTMIFVYEHTIKGFSARIPDDAIPALRRHPLIATIEPDRVVEAYSQEIPLGVLRIDADQNPAVKINGHDERVDVDVAILDTGIDLDHPDLNVYRSIDCTGGDVFEGICSDGGDDDNGHGTHVAGIVGALDNDFGVVGVAPGARLWAIKVLGSNGTGYTSWIMAGIEWVTQHAEEIEVVNMSLGGTGSEGSCSDGGYHQVICQSINTGITYVVAAGNDARDVSDYVPANYDEVITVSALADFDGKANGEAQATCRPDEDDTFLNISNFGSDVDLIAPGACIRSTWIGGGYRINSGTSMASPHVAGAAALYISGQSSRPDPSTVKVALLNAGSTDWNNADDKDAMKEVLLNVNHATFAPELIGESTTPQNSLPTIKIINPSAGEVSKTVSIQIEALDADHDPLTVLWAVDGKGPWLSASYTGSGDLYMATWDTETFSNGSHSISARAIDSHDGASTTASVDVSINNTPVSSLISLSASKRNVNKMGYADLVWNGASGSRIKVYRNGKVIKRALNSGSYSDRVARAKGAFTYKICEEGNTPTCSNESSVSF